MKRRKTIAALLALGASAAVPARLARGQRSPAAFRIGFLFPSNPAMRGVFVATMKDHGWVERRDFVIVQPEIAREASDPEAQARRMLAEKPDLIITLGTARALAAHRLTSTIPIVMWTSGYPVEAGLANSLARPGKNVTGNTIYAGAAVWGKMVGLLRETKPDIKRVAALWGYSPPRFLRAEIDPAQEEIRQAARVLGLSAHITEYSRPEQLSGAVERIGNERSDALIIAGRASLGDARGRVLRFAAERRMPTIVDSRWPASDDPYPLLAYGASFELPMAQTMFYVDRILKGARAADLPIQQPSKIELVVNLKTAKALGIKIPPSILLRAEWVIE